MCHSLRPSLGACAISYLQNATTVSMAHAIDIHTHLDIECQLRCDSCICQYLCHPYDIEKERLHPQSRNRVHQICCEIYFQRMHCEVEWSLHNHFVNSTEYYVSHQP